MARSPHRALGQQSRTAPTILGDSGIKGDSFKPSEVTGNIVLCPQLGNSTTDQGFAQETRKKQAQQHMARATSQTPSPQKHTNMFVFKPEGPS